MNAMISGALCPGYLHLHIGHRNEQLPDSETNQLKDNLGDHKHSSLQRRGMPYEHDRSFDFVVSSICGSVLHRQS